MPTPTTVTQFRCPTALWEQAKESGRARGLSANRYVLRALRAQLARDAREMSSTTNAKD